METPSSSSSETRGDYEHWRANGTNVEVLRADLSVRADLDRVCERLQKDPGDGKPPIDPLANNTRFLHRPPVPGVASGELRSYRGQNLKDFDGKVRYYLDCCREIAGLDLDLDKAEQVWNRSLALPEDGRPQEDRWYHGDLVAENLLLKDGRLSAVIDFGSVAVGDPTVDLHGAWELFDPPEREIFAERVGVSEAEWFRGRAWALGIALGAVSYYWDTLPRRREDRLAMARNALNG